MIKTNPREVYFKNLMILLLRAFPLLFMVVAWGREPGVCGRKKTVLWGAIVWMMVALFWLLSLLIFLRQLFEMILDILAVRNGLFRRTDLCPDESRDNADATPSRVAILVPAWQEEAVIAAMLEQAAAACADAACRIYVGCYPNDAGTRREVSRVARRHAMVRPVLLPHPGPTSKADCLNHLYRVARAEWAPAIFLLHDAEDLIDAAELAILRRVLARDPAVAFVQFPVRAHREPRCAPIAHLYADEFADAHQRVQPLRARLTGAALSAGVGTAIRAAALHALAEDNRGKPFAADCLTEDYLLALALARRGARSCFLLPWIRERRKAWKLVAVEECFPDRMKAAIRQRARWMIGIALQAPRRLGWFGNGWHRLFLLQDRLMIVFALADLAALLLASCGLVALACGWETMVRTPLGPAGATCAAANLLLGFWRLGMRSWMTARLYGWRFASAAPLRWPLGIVINGAAAGRACLLYWSALARRRLPRWDKTAHRFPAIAAQKGL